MHYTEEEHERIIERVSAAYEKDLAEANARSEELERRLADAVAIVGLMERRAEEAEQKLAEYKASKFTVDAQSMLDALHSGQCLELSNIIRFEAGSGEVRMGMGGRSKAVTREFAMNMIGALVAVMRFERERDEAREARDEDE